MRFDVVKFHLPSPKHNFFTNITGWKDKDLEYITEYNGKYYGYHKENGVVHYHQVKWEEENKKWVIVTPAVYYDENFNKIENNYNEDANKIEVQLVKTVDGGYCEVQNGWGTSNS